MSATCPDHYSFVVGSRRCFFTLLPINGVTVASVSWVGGRPEQLTPLEAREYLLGRDQAVGVLFGDQDQIVDDSLGHLH
jgi:hypothetical protein